MNMDIKFKAEEIPFKKDLLYANDFVEKDGRKFFVRENYSLMNEYSLYTAFELFKDGDLFTAKPVVIKARSDRFDTIIEVKDLLAWKPQNYYSYYRSLIREFVSEGSEFIDFEPKSVLKVFMDIWTEYPSDSFYDAKEDSFDLSVFDSFYIRGDVRIGCGGELILSMIGLYTYEAQELIAVLPEATLNHVGNSIPSKDIYKSLMPVITEGVRASVKDFLK